MGAPVEHWAQMAATDAPWPGQPPRACVPQVLPGWLTTVTLAALLALISYKTALKAADILSKERRALRGATARMLAVDAEGGDFFERIPTPLLASLAPAGSNGGSSETSPLLPPPAPVFDGAGQDTPPAAPAIKLKFGGSAGTSMASSAASSSSKLGDVETGGAGAAAGSSGSLGALRRLAFSGTQAPSYAGSEAVGEEGLGRASTEPVAIGPGYAAHVLDLLTPVM